MKCDENMQELCVRLIWLWFLDSMNWFLFFFAFLFSGVYFVFGLFKKRRSRWLVIIVIRRKEAKSTFVYIRKTHLMNGLIRVNVEIRRNIFCHSAPVALKLFMPSWMKRRKIFFCCMKWFDEIAWEFPLQKGKLNCWMCEEV